MTDKQILDEVYRRLKEPDDPHGWKTNPLKNGVTSFIEQEWQKADDQELVDQYNRNRKPEDWIKDVKDIGPPPSWVKDEWHHSYPAVDPCTSDVKEIEHQHGLEIGLDGTVGISGCCPIGPRGEIGEKGIE